MEKYSPEHYEEYKQFLLEYYYSKDNGETLSRLVEQEKKLAPNQSAEYWQNEIVANASEMFINDESAMRALISEHADVAQTVDNWFKKMNYALRRAFRGVVTSGSAEADAAKELQANVAAFSEAQKRWSSLLKESVEAKKAVGTAEESGEAKYSMRIDSDAVTLNVEKSTDMDTYTYDNIAIMLDGKEVGTIGMVVDESEPYLERIDIDEKYRNKGIGTDALRLVAEKYGEFLIAPDNEDAKRLYERYGDESNSDNAPYLDQGYGVYSISSVPEGKGYMARREESERNRNVRYSLRAYTDKQKENWSNSKRIVVYENDSQYRGFIREALQNNQSDKKMYFGAIPSDLADEIFDRTGIRVEGYNCSISAYEVRKILKDHGDKSKEALRGQRAITEDDFVNIPSVIQSPLDISKSSSMYNGKPAIMFKGNSNGQMTVVAVVSDKRLDLFVQTAYVGIKNRNLATPIDEQASINTPEANNGTVSKNIMLQNEENVNTQFSMRVDSDGRELSEAQQEFFKDSKVRDEEGRLLTVYHATDNDFTVFDKEKLGMVTDSNADDVAFAATAHIGFWFNSDNIQEKTAQDKALSGYLKIESPYYVDSVRTLSEQVTDIYGENYDEFQERFESGDYKSARELGERFVDWLEQEGYDGVIVDDEEFGGTSYVALDSNQFKNATNQSPTENPDIRFSMRQNITGDSGKVYGDGVYLDSNLLDGLSDKERVQMVKARIAELGGQTFTAYDGDTPVEIKIENSRKRFENKSGRFVQVNKDLTVKHIGQKIKQEAVVLSDELISASNYKENAPAHHSHGWLDNNGKNDWEKRTVIIQEKNNSVWKATLHIANAQNGEKILYDIDPIKKVESPRKLGATSTTDSIRQNGENVNTQFSMRVDSDYMKAVESGDTETAQKLVDEAAKAAGYDSEPLYHGTQNFGFTKLDVSKSDDEISFFTTSNPDMAQTYSGKSGTKKISEALGNISNLTAEEVVDRLNKESVTDGFGMESKYRVMRPADIKAFLVDVDKRIEKLDNVVDKKIMEYADRLATDFNDSDYKAHNQLRRLSEALQDYSYGKMSTPLWVLLNNTDVFNSAEKRRYSTLEADIRLRNGLTTKKGIDEGAVIRESLDRYEIRVKTFEEAKSELEAYANSGNYALRGKTEGLLEIDGDGNNWNNIFATLEPKGGNTLRAEYDFSTSSIKLSDKNGEFANIPAKTLSEAEPAIARAITKQYGSYLASTVFAQAKDQLRNSATAEVAIKTTGRTDTRNIAQFAKEQGYRGAKITNIYDNGGRGANADTGNVYIYFNPQEDVKSADAVTYDNKGKVIPLSERFNAENDDIRYSKRQGSFSKALTSDEWKKYNNAMTSKMDAGLRINDHAMLVESEKGDYSYKLVIYDNTLPDNPISAVYAIVARQDPNAKRNFYERDVARFITDMEDKYGKRTVYKDVLKSYSKTIGYVFGRYSNESGRFYKYGQTLRGSDEQAGLEGTVGSGVSERVGETGSVSDLGKVQYQLRIEDKNRLDILDKQETRLTADLKTLEKAYAEAIRAEYERSIKPNEETSRRAAEINRKAAKRYMNEVGATFHVPKDARTQYLLPIINEIIDKGPAISESEGLIEQLYRTAYAHSAEYVVESSEDDKALRDYIRKTAIYVDPGTRGDVGDYEALRKNNMGSLKLTGDTNALSIDEFYDEVKSSAPGVFSDTTDGAEQLYELSAFMKNKGKTENIGDYMSCKNAHLSVRIFAIISARAQGRAQILFRKRKGAQPIFLFRGR